MWNHILHLLPDHTEANKGRRTFRPTISQQVFNELLLCARSVPGVCSLSDSLALLSFFCIGHMAEISHHREAIPQGKTPRDIYLRYQEYAGKSIFLGCKNSSCKNLPYQTPFPFGIDSVPGWKDRESMRWVSAKVSGFSAETKSPHSGDTLQDSCVAPSETETELSGSDIRSMFRQEARFREAYKDFPQSYQSLVAQTSLACILSITGIQFSFSEGHYHVSTQPCSLYMHAHLPFPRNPGTSEPSGIVASLTNCASCF